MRQKLFGELAWAADGAPLKLLAEFIGLDLLKGEGQGKGRNRMDVRRREGNQRKGRDGKLRPTVIFSSRRL